MLLRANALAAQFRRTAPQAGALRRLFADPGAARGASRPAARAAATPARRVDVALLIGLAKLDDCASLTEADAMLTRQEKMAVLSDARGIDRLAALSVAAGATPARGEGGSTMRERSTRRKSEPLRFSRLTDHAALANVQTFSRHLTNSRAGAGRPK